MKQNDQIHVTIVGEGYDKERLERMVKDRGLGNYISLTGKISMEKYKTLMADADVVINAALKDDVHLAADSGCRRGNVFGNVEAECVEECAAVLVSRYCPPFDFGQVIGSEICHCAALAQDFALHLSLSVLSAEAHLDKRECRAGACSLRGEWTIPAKSVVLSKTFIFSSNAIDINVTSESIIFR